MTEDDEHSCCSPTVAGGCVSLDTRWYRGARSPRAWSDRGGEGQSVRVARRLEALVGVLAFVAMTTVSGGPAGAAAADKPGRNGRQLHLGDLQHIVVLMQENRSYDHYFGALHREGQPASEAERT